MKIVCLASALVLSAGILFAGSQGDKSSSQSSQTTLNLWHIYNDQGRGVPIEKAVRRFEAANPGVKVAISTYANDPYKTKLKTVSGSDFPDVFHSWGGGWLKSFVDAGLVADITAEANAMSGQLNQTMVNLSRFNGKVYGVPYTGGGTILFYNKDIFARFNLQPPKTFADLENICQTLLANNITPFALANKTKWPGAQHFVLVSMRLGGADVFQQANDKKIAFTDNTFIRAGQMVQDMVDKGWFPAGANGLDWDTGQSRMLMYTEQCAMIVQTTGFLGTCRSENPDFYAKKVGLALYPAVDGGKGKATDILGGANAFSVSASAKNRDLAAKLALFLATDTELQQEFLNNGVVAAKPDIQTQDALVREALKQLADASFLQNYIDQTLSPELAEVHKDTTQGLYGKTLTPQQAADAMQKAFDAQ
ncbi:MAG: extracellular solute-binding protein [Spirochaetaceae bacterium]|jgi:raffinose/stachyose/melibiose transport system substrate-binding protein|nr:extracellular solute-binding protein [Spirochaetaceae bacterium]